LDGPDVSFAPLSERCAEIYFIRFILDRVVGAS
jgi:hypothetical protein